MRFSIDGMAAPVAMIGAAARGDYRDGADSVMLSPDLQIAIDVYSLPIRPRLCIQVRDQCGWRILDDGAVLSTEDDPRNRLPLGLVRSGTKEMFHGDLAFAGHDDICSCSKVFGGVI